MENTGLQDGVEIDVMLPSSTLHKCANMEFNNKYDYSLMNGKMSTPKYSSVSTLNSTSLTSINYQVGSLQNPIH